MAPRTLVRYNGMAPACVNTRGPAKTSGGPDVANGSSSHCANGHPWDDENTRTRPDGSRKCRACHRSSTQRRRDQARAQRPAPAPRTPGREPTRGPREYGPKSQTPERRFWRYVDRRSDAECWNWVGGRTGKYGAFRLSRAEPTSAHRFSFELHHGPIPDRMVVCHHCDNPPCVNPAHLFAGTQQENIDDMWAKGRWRPGVIPLEKRGRRCDPLEVHALRSAGLTYREIGIRLGVATMTAHSALRRWSSAGDRP